LTGKRNTFPDRKVQVTKQLSDLFK